MEVIYVISPDYLSALLEEVKKYTFRLQGYGNFSDAYNGLVFVNVESLLGFVFLSDTFPSVSSKEFSELSNFIKLLDSLNVTKKFLVCTRSRVSSSAFAKITKDLKFLRVELMQDIEYVSDTIINKKIFGNILLDNFEPYCINKNKSHDNVVVNKHDFGVKPLISSNILAVLNKVSKLSSVSHTLEMDSVFQYYKQHNSLLARLRELIVKKAFNVDIEDDLQKIKDEIEGEPNEFTLDYLTIINSINKCHYGKEVAYGN